MNPIQVTVTPTELATEDDLFNLFRELVSLDAGWSGAGVGFSADSAVQPQVPTWTMHAQAADETAPGGARRLRADIGDIRIDVNGVFSEVLTADAYAAKYGATS
jgi:hypothetical protein